MRNKLNINISPAKILVLSFCVMALVSVNVFATDGIKLEKPLMDRIVEQSPNIDSLISVRTEELHDGLRLTESSFLCQHQVNHLFILEVDLDQDFSIRPSSPDNLPISGKKQDMLGQVLAAEQSGVQVCYAVNGDVFGGYREDLPGQSVPMGILVVDGKPMQSYHHRLAENVIYVRKDGTVNIDRYDRYYNEKNDILHAIGAWHTLVWNGKEAPVPEDMLGQGYHPRTFLGVTKNRRKVFIFVVDGRQPIWSNGLQMKDMIDICLAAGCDRAVNLDGGGSTTLVGKVEGKTVVLNRPSDENNQPRAVVDGLLVVKKRNLSNTN